jgi:hypothetical protein
MKKPFRQSTKKNMPSSWFSKSPHTHNGLDDAIEQGKLFLSMMSERYGKNKTSPNTLIVQNLAKPAVNLGNMAATYVPTQKPTGVQG